MKNAFIEQFGKHRKGGHGTRSQPNHAKSLAGVSIVAGFGGQTNGKDCYEGNSSRGMKEAMSPSGPSK